MLEKKLVFNVTTAFLQFIFVASLAAQTVETSTETSATEVTTTTAVPAEETTMTAAMDDLTAQADNTTTVTDELTTPADELNPTEEMDSRTTHVVADAGPVADAATSVSLPGGVYYQVMKEGSGAEASTTGTRLIHYTLFLTDGQKLESSREAEFPVPFSFAPGADQAIKGMEAGTNGMRVGEVRKLYVPADQGYGDVSHGNVPPNSALVFTVELVDVK